MFFTLLFSCFVCSLLFQSFQAIPPTFFFDQNKTKEEIYGENVSVKSVSQNVDIWPHLHVLSCSCQRARTKTERQYFTIPGSARERTHQPPPHNKSTSLPNTHMPLLLRFVSHGILWPVLPSKSGASISDALRRRDLGTVDSMLLASRPRDQIVAFYPSRLAIPLIAVATHGGDQIVSTAAPRPQARRYVGTPPPPPRLWRGRRSGSCPLRFPGIRR